MEEGGKLKSFKEEEMNRREFLKKIPLFGALAVPTAALAITASADSKTAIEKMQDVIIHKDGVTIQNCSFTMGGNLQLKGDYQTIHSCHIQANGGTAVQVWNKGNFS